LITLPQKHLTQPQYAAPVDYQGLGKGAQFVFNPAAGPIDLVTNRVWAFGGDTSVVSAQQGKAFNFVSEDYLEFTGYPEIVGNVGTMAIWLPRVGVDDAFGQIYLVESTAAYFNQVTPGGVVYFGGVGSSGALPLWFSSSNRSLVLTSDGTAGGTKCYVDGEDSGLTWGSPPGSWPAGDKQIRIGNYMNSTGFSTDGSMLSIAYESRVWGLAEARAFHDTHGNALYKSNARRIYLVPSGSGSTGTVAKTNANDTSVASGTTTVTGSLAKTNSNDTSVASGTTTVTGSLAKTNANDTSNASGSVGSAVSGSVARTNANDTSVASGTTTVTGSLAKTNANDTSVASGSTTVTGALARTNANDTCVASGAAGAISGTVAVTNANDTSAASGVVGSVSGSVARTNSNDTCSASGVSGVVIDADGGDDAPTRVIYKKRKKTLEEQPGKHLESIIAKAIKEVTGEPEEALPNGSKLAPVNALSPKSSVLPIIPKEPDISPEVHAEELEKVATLLAQYHEQVRHAQAHEDEELLMLIAEMF
jgi:hypothetical protein